MRALVSVSDKSGLIDFLKPLQVKNLQIVSTGGTLKYLRQEGFQAQDISEVTGFPEVLDGRVKTLHPFVHMGLLAQRELPSHHQQMQDHKVEYFDLVIGNLYPFEKTALSSNATFEDLIENIDIGGPSFLRSSAKNYKNVIVVCDPHDYSWVQKKILENDFSLDDRKKLALKVFSLTSYYDSLIFNKLSQGEVNSEYLNIPLKQKQSLRYGENSHQSATWYENPLSPRSLSSAQILQGKELSYNNILDIDAAAELVHYLDESSCVAVKHNNPCGVGSAKSCLQAAQKAVEADPKSVFGGILAFNTCVDLATVEYLKNIFLECIVAPAFSDEALKFLESKKNLRVLQWPDLKKKFQERQFKSVAGGVLAQSQDDLHIKNEWQFIGEKPNEGVLQSAVFGEKVVTYLKSNAIAIVHQGQTLGLGMGQVNRVDSVQLALQRLQEFRQRHPVDLNQIVVVSDAFFPFSDSLQSLHEHGMKWVVQPGGSVKDKEVFEYAEKNGINLMITGKRHFKH